MMKKHNKRSDCSVKEKKASDWKGEPIKKLSFELIKLITNDFSEELGHGAFGQVFKGVLEDGEEVAVKMFRFMADINGKQFENECKILERLNHPRIVRLIGFCHEEEEELAEYKGKLIVAQRIHRALCLEYMPNGSLGNLLSGEDLGVRWDWVRRLKTIKGICWGLEYLHVGLEFPIFHLDLKPDNILLDGYMSPNISDFGLSRLIGEENSKETLTPLGTLGYIPPEFINSQVISKEYDIFSLGVIITKIVTGGITGYSIADMSAEEFAEYVHDNWKKRLQEMPGSLPSLDVVHCKQVKRCIEIAITCMENDRHKRPTITDIICQLPKETIFFSMFDPSSRLPRRKPVWSREKKCTTNTHKNPPSEISYSTHPEHTLKLMTTPGEPFLCDGCKEPGYGPRYTCDCGGGRGQSLDRHTRCALADDPRFSLHTLLLPLFGYGKQFQFRFLHEAPQSSVEEGRTRVCDACGEPTRGFVYHCSEHDLDLHPCCGSLPDRLIQDGGRAFDLRRRASRTCALCPENEGHRRWFWAYRRCKSDSEDAVELHVACLKETARRSWEGYYGNRDVGEDAALNVDSMLENKFGETAGTVASFITAMVFGNLILKV